MDDTSQAKQYHHHWNAYDYEVGEGSRMDALHALIVVAPFDKEASAPVIEQITSMARSKG